VVKRVKVAPRLVVSLAQFVCSMSYHVGVHWGPENLRAPAPNFLGWGVWRVP